MDSKKDLETPIPVVLWAVDPFAGDMRIQKEAGYAIKAFCNKREAVIQPVYAASHPLPNLSEAFNSEVFENIRKRASEEFEEFTQGIKLKSVLPLTVLRVQRHSISEQVVALLSYARSVGAEMIVAGTRARRGPARWFFGSFVELLTLTSEIPLLIVNPTWKRRAPGYRNILFPTDFSEKSHQAFEEVMKFAKNMGSRILIFHKFNHIYASAWDFGFGVSDVYAEIERNGLKMMKERGKKWEKEAKEFGADVNLELDTRVGGTVAGSILKKSKTMPCVIAMAAQSGPLEASLAGSAARAVLREATVPVWLMHPTTTKNLIKSQAIA